MKTGWDWKKTYPVVHLDMQKLKSTTAEGLERNLYGKAKSLAAQFNL